MENATKALLIAAAVLVAIIIISLTLAIVRQGQETVSGTDLSETEAAQFNSKFINYEGTSVSTSQVNALLNTVFSHNKNELASGEERYVKVTLNTNSSSSEVIKTGSANVSADSDVPKVSGSLYYKVTCKYTGSIITEIEIVKK